MSTGTPKVSVSVSTGNLLRQIQVIDGVAGIVGTCTQTGNIGTVQKVFGYDDAVAKGYTVADEPFMNAQIRMFYDELGGNQELWIMGVEDTMTRTQMCTLSNGNGIKKLLLESQGRVNLVYVCRDDYTTFILEGFYLNGDVTGALTSSKALCQYQQSINRPIRLLIEGRINSDFEEPEEINSYNNTYAGVVIGSTTDDNAGTLGVLALARACKYAAHVKLGNGQNGALSISQAYIGSQKVENFLPEVLDSLSDKGYIIVHKREGAAGYYFGVDNMAGTDDFHILVHGRLIDKAQRIATATSTPFLETSVRVNPDGTINATDATYLEEVIIAQIKSQMRNQISGVDVIVATDQDIINSSTLPIQVKIQPLGYLTWIAITMGLTTNL